MRRLLHLSLFFAIPLRAQDAPPALPQDTAALRALSNSTDTGRPEKRSFRARLRANDRRVMVVRRGMAVWLADTSAIVADSTILDVTVAGSSVQLKDSEGHCLSMGQSDPRAALEFTACDSPLRTHPAVDEKIASGQAGFWLLTRYGKAGPTEHSPLLLARSRSSVWFWLERVP